MRLFGKFYLDKEKDIVIELYQDDMGLSYVLKTPNHTTSNLIKNIAKLINVKMEKDENDFFIIKGRVDCFIDGNNQEMHLLKFNERLVCEIYPNGYIDQKVIIPAINKTLMSQTKDYDLSLDETLVSSYILKECKFHTDLHSHFNGNLSADNLIALGIYHQIRYPLYYIKKLNLLLTDKQQNVLMKKRKVVEKQFEDCKLKGKHFERKIDDNVFINFADLILNNLENSEYNLKKIRNSLTILKDSQAVFTNLEKLYLYRYVFAKGIPFTSKIKLHDIDKITDDEIRNYLKKIINDHKQEYFKNNSLYQDKLLWTARTYQKQGILLAYISDTSFAKKALSTLLLEEIHQVLPIIEKQTGVSLRFLAAIRRMPLTLVKATIEPYNYLKDNLVVLKSILHDPYIVGIDIVGEEINEIDDLQPFIREITHLAKNYPEFVFQIHAGENSSLKDNVYNAVRCVKDSLLPKQKMLEVRIGHGLFTADLDSNKGKKLIKLLKENNVTLEFQLTSNVRLNNLNHFNDHPLKRYLASGIRCVQGSDGLGLYGSSMIEEQLTSMNLLKLDEKDIKKIVSYENEIIDKEKKRFSLKEGQFKKYLGNKTLKEKMDEEIEINEKENIHISFKEKDNLLSEVVLKEKMAQLPLDKLPIVLAGGSFNSKGIVTKVNKDVKKIIDKLLKEQDPSKCYFVVGHKLEGYEKYLVSKNKKFDIYAIIPAIISKEEKEKLEKENLKIVVSIEPFYQGIYKSFNYEIFERIPSVVVALDGNSAAENLIQEAKNGKAKAKIFVYAYAKSLMSKSESLKGYIKLFDENDDIGALF